MPDEDHPHLNQPSGVRAAEGLRVFQFSLTSVFVITTVMALILAIYFGVGRLVGMSTSDVLTQGLSRLLFTVPTLLVWIVGLTLAIRRLKRNRVPATLAIIALSGLVLTSLVFQVLQMALIHSVNSGQISDEFLSWGFPFMGALNSVLSAALWILILMATFFQRPADAVETQRSDFNRDPS